MFSAGVLLLGKFLCRLEILTNHLALKSRLFYA